jgi:rare lipoprotein A
VGRGNWSAAFLALLLSGCFGGAAVDEDGFPDTAIVPADVTAIPDARPVAEPRSRYGNPPDYEVAGERYFVLTSAAGYKERGRASWYGTKFHGKRTSSGETYDMFGMTAAHKTLPLPTYVRVTHLGNGRSVVVKVNDRGPFHQGRIIDLSYAAAARLDILGHGSADVEVEAIDPDRAVPAPTTVAATPAPKFLEVGGKTDDPIYAVALREEVAALGIDAVEIRSIEQGDEVWHRVLAGPFADRASLEAARRRLEAGQLAAKAVDE